MAQPLLQPQLNTYLKYVFLFYFTVYSALIAILFSFFLIYDTQQIIGGKKYEMSPEEHVYASITLYIDVVYIFLAILNLGRGR